MKKLTPVMSKLTLILAFGAFTFLMACEEDPEEEVASCTGCSADAPYSTTSANTCYETLSECESAESGNCV